MGDNAPWTREFSTASSFTDDLGCMGIWVGPRKGPTKGTQGQKENYVLRRVLVALRCQGKLSFPFDVCKSESPDYLISDASGTWGLEVTEAGSEKYQKELAYRESSSPANLDPIPCDDGVGEIRRSIAKKNEKHDKGVYQRPGLHGCDLAVYDNTNSYSTGFEAIASVNDASLKGRFRRVFFVRDRHVYTDVLCDQSNKPEFVDLSHDYNIDFAEWVRNQVNLLRTGGMSRLDVEELVEELSELARSQRRALRSHLQNLLLHLLKWQFQPERRGNSRQRSIDNARDKIDDLLMESPSIKDEFTDIEKWYRRARRDAARETAIQVDDLPETCPFDLDSEVLSEDWLPASTTREGG